MPPFKGTTEDTRNCFHSNFTPFKITTKPEYHLKRLKYHQWHMYHSLKNYYMFETSTYGGNFHSNTETAHYKLVKA